MRSPERNPHRGSERRDNRNLNHHINSYHRHNKQSENNRGEENFSNKNNKHQSRNSNRTVRIDSRRSNLPLALKQKETDQKRIDAREKQVSYGKNTIGYDNYRKAVPRNARILRKEEHPITPDKYQVCSKRSWDGQVKKWRRGLHLWDTNNETKDSLENNTETKIEENENENEKEDEDEIVINLEEEIDLDLDLSLEFDDPELDFNFDDTLGLEKEISYT